MKDLKARDLYKFVYIEALLFLKEVPTVPEFDTFYLNAYKIIHYKYVTEDFLSMLNVCFPM